jgi:hypothetical protein
VPCWSFVCLLEVASPLLAVLLPVRTAGDRYGRGSTQAFMAN